MQYKPTEILPSDLTPLIHQAALDPHLGENSFRNLCTASKHLNFGGFCTNLTQITTARKLLGPPNQTKLIAVIAFPFGSVPQFLKEAEAEWAAEQGADELEVMPNFVALNQNKADRFAEELFALSEIGLPVRVNLNLAKISLEQLNLAVEASIDAGIRNLQTGNGFGRAVTASDITLLKKLVRGRCTIKAVGGIKTLDHALALLAAGADQLGTSSGPEMVQSLRNLNSES